MQSTITVCNSLLHLRGFSFQVSIQILKEPLILIIMNNNLYESNATTCLDHVDHEFGADRCEDFCDLRPEGIGVDGVRGGCKDIAAVKAGSVGPKVARMSLVM